MGAVIHQCSCEPSLCTHRITQHQSPGAQEVGGVHVFSYSLMVLTQFASFLSTLTNNGKSVSDWTVSIASLPDQTTVRFNPSTPDGMREENGVPPKTVSFLIHNDHYRLVQGFQHLRTLLGGLDSMSWKYHHVTWHMEISSHKWWSDPSQEWPFWANPGRTLIPKSL